MDGMDGGANMVEDDDDGAEVVEMKMELEMETDWTSAKVGPKSRRRKRLVTNAAKKIKLGQEKLINNYFHLEGANSLGSKMKNKKSHKYSNL